MLITAAMLALSTLVPADIAAPAQVEVVTANGSGCRAGTTDISTSGRTFTINYRAFLAQAGGGAGPVEFRKNCQLNLRVSVPAGYTYALARTSYRGFAHLEAGANALHRLNIYFQGMPQTTSVSFPFNGPRSDDWQTTYRPDVASIVWAPCGEARNLNVNAELRVNLGTSDRSRRSFMLAESSRGVVRTKRC
ncbi:hypothetical protein Lesp02_31630 [Lentzea sp. NBRC 105346]|uniref:DUF4360 domain-containing protein n=1 Tax=Lentzea sp. NBRC 105346 TaxID=3032205 RepID=UPI0024A5F531|nr:DUF4360 domain-containing protein [Lentzea sp. NBRC 105346]GLZ30974.1 hypothetical protein Lesp02_31630 [Lentzea sp. NBRC 105346]